jgi:hypothetical protein
MASLRSPIATRVSRFSLVAAIAAFVACLHAVSTRNELKGTFLCGPQTCGSGELCLDFNVCGSNEPEPPDTYECATPPAGCQLAECYDDMFEGSGSDNCPSCVVDLCQGAANVISYDGDRTVSCERILF